MSTKTAARTSKEHQTKLGTANHKGREAMPAYAQPVSVRVLTDAAGLGSSLLTKTSKAKFGCQNTFWAHSEWLASNDHRPCDNVDNARNRDRQSSRWSTKFLPILPLHAPSCLRPANSYSEELSARNHTKKHVRKALCCLDTFL